MGVGSWWQKRKLWEQVLIVGAPGLSIGVLAGALVNRRRLTKAPAYTLTGDLPLPDILDFDSEEVDEEPPAGIVYDENDAPCVGPEPDEPLEAALEGAPEVYYCTPPKDLEPKPQTSVVFAEGAARPRWPLDTNAKRKLQVSYQDVRGKWHGRWGRHFGASRKRKSGGQRVHVDVDMFADPGDVVVATEAGEVLAALPFYKGTGALYLKTDSGMIINYGELEPGSWRSYGIHGGLGTGQRVNAGDPLARVGLSTDGSHMLHVEVFEPDVTVDQIRRGEMQWTKDTPAPAGVLDPTRYLVRSQRVKYEGMVEQV